jgi:hypothetical protein
MGTPYDANHTDKTYARIDGGPDAPGYFTAKSSVRYGDVNNDGIIDISDVIILIDDVLSGATAPTAADVNNDSHVDVADVTALIEMILNGY